MDAETALIIRDYRGERFRARANRWARVMKSHDVLTRRAKDGAGLGVYSREEAR